VRDYHRHRACFRGSIDALENIYERRRMLGDVPSLRVPERVHWRYIDDCIRLWPVREGRRCEALGSVMGERRNRECKLTAIDQDGNRWTATINAPSMFTAIFQYNNLVVCGNIKGHPKPTRETKFEIVVDGRLLETTFAKALDWSDGIKASTPVDGQPGPV